MQKDVEDAMKTGDARKLAETAKETLAVLIDSRIGHTVTDNAVFRAHAAKYEAEFINDLEALGIRPPDVLTRVTEYVGPVITFIEKIIENGYAYASNGSVYFNTKRYIHEGHDYPKLRPGGSSDLLAEGEGALTSADSEKINETDFALWKKSKVGEPMWDSPWGKGRPGWHIECSVMAGDILGENMDIHAGGDDLKFPHHDNEIAQSEAHFGCCQWVNYFIHAGRLNIDGLKMSKSLKNFTTIQATLTQCSARQMRIMFLRQQWDKTMMFQHDAVEEAKGKERDYKIFLGNSRSFVCEHGYDGPQDWDETDKKVADQLADQRAKAHAGLMDNFQTQKVMTALDTIVTTFNTYMDRAGDHAPRALLVRKAAEYVYHILTILGVIEDSGDYGDYGFGGDGATFKAAKPHLDRLAAFRDAVRACARAQDTAKVAEVCKDYSDATTTLVTHQAKPFADQFNGFHEKIQGLVNKSAGHVAFLEACDQVRDELLPQAGVALEDRDKKPSRWRLDDPTILMHEAAERQQAKQSGSAKKDSAKEIKRLQSKITKAEQELQKYKNAVPVEEYFKTGEHAGKYGSYGDDGVPTTTADGEPVVKSQQKKLKKASTVNEKDYKALADKGGSDFLLLLEKTISEDQAALAELGA